MLVVRQALTDGNYKTNEPHVFRSLAGSCFMWPIGPSAQRLIFLSLTDH